MLGPLRLGCGSRITGRRVALRAASRGIGADHEFGPGEQIGPGCAVAQIQSHEARQARLLFPDITPSQGAVLRELAEGERGEELAIEQSDRVAERELLETRTRAEPR